MILLKWQIVEEICWNNLMKYNTKNSLANKTVFMFSFKITSLSNCYTSQKYFIKVLELYKITSLSNRLAFNSFKSLVLEPYKITLLSNEYPHLMIYNTVLEPYKITLLSNLKQFEKNCCTRSENSRQVSTVGFNLIWT